MLMLSRSRLRGLVLAVAAMLLPAHLAAEEGVTRTHALAEYGEPKYGPGFGHFDYADPAAPKGGAVKLAEYGSFDSLNPLILRGEWPGSIGLIGDSLMLPSDDETGVVYGLIAESAEYPEDKSWVIFNLRPEARWHDGVPITARDFEYAMQILREHGRPFLKAFLEDVTSVEVLDDHRIKYSFRTRDRMKPLVTVASFGPQPRHWWTAEGRDPSRTTLEPPLGSGPYRLARVDPGRALVYERVPDYWAAHLPVNRGRNNFDTISYDFYRDQNVMFEAFKGGAYDFRVETSELRWATGYDIPAIRDGAIVKEAVHDETPAGIRAYFLNTRRPQLSDPRVREALAWLYDFEWVRKNLLYGHNERSATFFVNSEFGSSGLPEGKERELLESYRDRLPGSVLTEPFVPPETEGDGDIRRNLRQALRLMREAGWEVRDGRLVNARTGEPFRLDVLLITSDSERWTQPWIANLRRAGIDARIVMAPDVATWSRRIDDFDFDVVVALYTFFPPPGPELGSRFHSSQADIRGSANMTGVRDPVVDELLDRIVTATDLETLTAASRALDRVLLAGWYVVPLWHRDEIWIAYRSTLVRPATKPRYGVGFPDTWWHKGGAAASAPAPAPGPAGGG